VKFITCLALFIISTQYGYGQSPKKLPIMGYAQAWVKDCPSTLRCSLPRPLGQKQRIAFVLTENPRPGGIAHHKIEQTFAHLGLTLEYYWVSKFAKPGLEKGYVSIQAKLHQSGRMVASSGQYRADEGDVVFPVGFIAGPIHLKKQYGVSFTLNTK